MAAGNPLSPIAEESAPKSRITFANVAKVVVLAILVLVPAYLLWAHAEWFDDPEAIRAEVTEWGIWAPIAYMLLYAIGPSFLVPGAVMTVAAGLAFGTLWGSVYALLGADIGALVAFAAGRYLGRGFVKRAVGRRFHVMLDRIARHGFQIIFYLRVVPVIPYNALNLIAGASPISFRDYFWASMIGMIPGTVAFAFLGNELWHPTSPRFLLALVLIAACFAAGEVYRRLTAVKI